MSLLQKARQFAGIASNRGQVYGIERGTPRSEAIEAMRSLGFDPDSLASLASGEGDVAKARTPVAAAQEAFFDAMKALAVGMAREMTPEELKKAVFTDLERWDFAKARHSVRHAPSGQFAQAPTPSPKTGITWAHHGSVHPALASLGAAAPTMLKPPRKPGRDATGAEVSPPGPDHEYRPQTKPRTDGYVPQDDGATNMSPRVRKAAEDADLLGRISDEFARLSFLQPGSTRIW